MEVVGAWGQVGPRHDFLRCHDLHPHSVADFAGALAMLKPGPFPNGNVVRRLPLTSKCTTLGWATLHRQTQGPSTAKDDRVYEGKAWGYPHVILPTTND
jgi:hypothetical protein